MRRGSEEGLAGVGAAGVGVIFQSQGGAQCWVSIILEFREILEEKLPEASVDQGVHVFMLYILVGDCRHCSHFPFAHPQTQAKGPMGCLSSDLSAS